MKKEELEKAEFFEKKFGFVFKNRAYIIEALKHRSYLSVSKDKRTDSNERLEFLGDAVLDLVCTEFLFHQYIELLEGELSKMKSILVSRKVLGDVAKRISLGELILLNKGEDSTGGRERLSILANTLEAVIGAIYLDAGYEKSKQFVQTYLLDFCNDYIFRETLKNHKSELLELFQANDLGMPNYELVNESGPDHEKNFVVQVQIKDLVISEGSAAKKKTAEQIAAARALELISKGIITINALKEK